MRFRHLLVLFCLAANEGYADDHTPLRFSISGNELIASGEVDAEALEVFEDITSDNPEVTTLVLRYIGGSVDDEANVELARLVRDMGLTTLVPSDGLVASGGTDLFLAGVDRVLEPGACVGVHTWAAEDFTATDLPRSDPEHDRYLSYYEDIGVNTDFYWFTLKAAPAEKMHWMTAAEAARFDLSTNRPTSLGTQSICDMR